MYSPVPKHKTFRSKQYRSFVSTHPCGRCDKPGPSAPHHARIGFDEGGWGIKISDLRCVPRCSDCHVPLEHGGKPTPENDLLREMVKLLSEYIETNVGKGKP